MALPQLKLRVEPAELSKLALRLSELKYEEGAVAQLLGLWDLSQMDGNELPGYIWRCKEDASDLAALTLFFLLGEPVSNERLASVLGRENISNLLTCGALFRRKGALLSSVVLYPCLGHYFVTDYWVTAGQEPGQVYELGTDSFVLARITPRASKQNALDLCTGSGIHAILSASQCASAEAVDINPRALDYTEFNAALNGVELNRHLGDLYTVLEDRRYDLITANPPYVPSPDKEVLVHRSAGETGEEVPERLVAGLPHRLNPGGLFSMILEYPVLSSETYLERLERWLGESKGWGIVVLSFGEKSVSKYIKLHMGPSENYNAKFEAYLKSYAEQGITAIDFANVYILRDPNPERPNWKLLKKTFWPNVSLTDQIRDWLKCQADYRAPEWNPDPAWKPRLSTHYTKLWRDWDHEQGLLEASEHNWLPGEPLNKDEAELMAGMRGEKTVKELRSEWSGDSESFEQAFRGLGLRMALV